MELKQKYQNCKTKGYKDLENYFFKEKLIFSKKDNPEEVKKKFRSEELYKRSRVWLLFARKENREDCNWESLQVAQSKNNVLSEITEDIDFLFSKLFSRLAIDSDNISYTNSTFYKEICPIDKSKKENKREILYSKIGSEYEYFQFCFLDVDNYLEIKSNSSINKTDAERIIEICKNQYAEAKIAFETLALYWNYYSSGIDGQTIAYIADHRSEFLEKKRLE